MKISGLAVRTTLPPSPDAGAGSPAGRSGDGGARRLRPHQRCHFLAKVAMKAAHMKVPIIA